MEISVDPTDTDPHAPSRAEVLDHLARVLESREFRAARNRARFLEYVITRSLDGGEQSLKEYTIGVDVFDRGASFDPRTDGVVRTQAGLVRKHLERYYATEGQVDALEIVLPKGHYVPHVQRRPAPPPTLDPTSSPTSATRVAAGTSVASANGGLSEMDRPAAPAWRRWMGERRGLRLVGIAAGALAVVAAVAGIARVARGLNTAAATATTTNAATLNAGGAGSPLWGAFAAPGASTVLAFGVPQFFAAPDDGLWLRDTAVNAPTSDALAGSHLDGLRRQLRGFRLEPAEAYTGIGEAYGVFLLSRFFLGQSHDLRVVRSPTLTWDHLKHENVIFLTSARFKTLADQLSYPSEFLHVVGTPNRVVNVHPAAGEQPEYVSEVARPTSVDYAIISLWPGKRAGRRVLVLSGGHTWGTQAAAEFVTERDYLRELEAHLLACQRRQGLPRHPEFFQVLLRVEIRDNQPIGVRYLTHHDLAISETGEPTDGRRGALAANANAR